MQAPLRTHDPRRLGPYRLLGRLGRGGMGTVFLGEDEEARRVAVKVINPELADDEAFADRFRREVTSARRVRRFCTAAVLDARLDGEPLYVVTEYVDGPALDEAVRDRGPLSGGDLEALAVNIATALGAIHAAGIVHRDLKPSNVLLSPTGPRVIDFGIARALDTADGPTRTGQFVGTPAYIAPEIMRGEEITPAADVFSWGCVVAYAGTGRPPFGGETVPATMQRVMNAPPTLDGLDPAVRDLVERALAKDPAERPTVRRLVQELTGEDQPDAPPPTTALTTPLPAETPEASLDAPQEAPPEPPPAAAPELPEGTPQTRSEAPPPEASQEVLVEGASQVRSEGPPEGPSEGRGPVTEPTRMDAVEETRPGAAGPALPPPAPPPLPPSHGSPAARRPWPGRNRRHLAAVAAVAAVLGAGTLFGLVRSGGDGHGGDSGGSASQASLDFTGHPPKIDETLLKEDFDDAGSGWRDSGASTWDARYRDKQYEMRVLPWTALTAVPAPVEDMPDDQLVEARVQLGDAGGEAGLYCRGRGGLGYGFLLRADGRVRIVADGPGGVRNLAAAYVPDVRAGRDQRVQAACARDGGSVRLGMWVNGDAAAQARVADTSDARGTASGLVVSRPDGTAGQPAARFDDVRLCSLD
ncbi:serine/threonine-protein kinase [Actinomadura fibrosa]|uniref:Serine/threonine-protein kinase n=1 Tax=Actinomadura fibrosa TaxID=111802 RepID=A0ABW2XN07_9ACTN|nr:serine/threonine-protein kinase [Actinomadura fibrosa]